MRTVRVDKETEQMKTTLAKTHIMILLAVFLTAPLLANLPCVTGTCTGEDSCLICDKEKTGASGKDMSRSLNSMRVPGTGNASNGSLQVAISFGNVPNEHLSLPAEFSVYARDASPLVFSPQLLQYRNPLCERIAQIDIAPGREAAVLGNGWQAAMAAREGDASYVRLLADADGLAGFTHQVRLPAERRGQLLFRFRVGETEALPYGELSTSGRRLAMRASDGSPTTSVPAFYDLLEPDGCVVRYDAAHGDPLWLRTAQGRTVTPAAAGMEAVFDADGIVRQVRSSADGLADIVPDGDNGYELRFYAPSQVLPKTNGLYGADGTPHTVWRVSRPVAGSDTRVDVTRTSGGTSRKWEFEYSRNSEDWVLRRPGGLSDKSRSTTTSPDGLLKTTLE